MLGLFDLLPSKAELQRRAEVRAQRMAAAVPWTHDIRWEPRLNIQASTYKVRSLFEVPPAPPHIDNTKPESMIVSPTGRWCYVEKVLPAGGKLLTFNGRQQGDVLFDGPVITPALHERLPGGWADDPWMSLTPMELLSLRPGTQRAKGDVIVAGLGLGHQLIEVSLRKQVKRLVLVEQSQELVDWLLPHIRLFLGREIEVVVGDAYAIMPTMRADVALVDIFKDCGSNAWERDRLRKTCKDIKFIWAWGAQDIR